MISDHAQQAAIVLIVVNTHNQSVLYHSVGKSLSMRGEKRLGRKRYPQNGVTGGRAARDEGGEDRPLTNLKFRQK